MEIGTTISGWKFIEDFARGGNGKIWKVQKDGKVAVLKSLQQRHLRSKDRVARFLDEIEVMRQCQDLKGVLPLLDFYAPVSPTANNLPWYCTELAIPMTKRIGEKSSVDDVLAACLQIAEILTALHERGISHRDIKPENLFYLNDGWVVGDFGLASFPTKGEITQSGAKLGPLHYIAPEMLNDPNAADGSSADVFSLGKLLWKLLTGQTYPLQGPHDSEERISSVKSYIGDPRAGTLDKLIEAATHLDPNRRISAESFASELSASLSGPAAIPEDISGVDISELAAVFDELSNSDWYEMQERRNTNNSSERGKVVDFLGKFKPLLDDFCARLNTQSLASEAKVSLQQGGPTHIPYLFKFFRNEDYYTEQIVVQARIRPTINLREFEFVGGLNFFSPIRRDEHGIEYLKGSGARVGAAFFIRDHNNETLDGIVPIWSEDHEVVFGGPSEGDLVAHLAQQLAQHFGMAVADFLKYARKQVEAGGGT